MSPRISEQSISFSPSSPSQIILPKLTQTSFVSIDQRKKEEIFSVYPNPNNGQIWINQSTDEKSYDCQITTLSGKVVKKEKNLIGSNYIDLVTLSNGVYILSLSTEDGDYYTKKIIKQ